MRWRAAPRLGKRVWVTMHEMFPHLLLEHELIVTSMLCQAAPGQLDLSRALSLKACQLKFLPRTRYFAGV